MQKNKSNVIKIYFNNIQILLEFVKIRLKLNLKNLITIFLELFTC